MAGAPVGAEALSAAVSVARCVYRDRGSERVVTQ